jgi:hypothetical protein
MNGRFVSVAKVCISLKDFKTSIIMESISLSALPVKIIDRRFYQASRIEPSQKKERILGTVLLTLWVWHNNYYNLWIA